jgi:hypothetical protein
MKLNFKMYSTLPDKRSHWWQVVLFPTISVMNNIQKRDPYIAFNIEWLFWSVTTIISYGNPQKEPTPYFKG